MTYLGDFAAGAIIDFKFGSRAADGTSVTFTGTVSNIEIYKDNSTTERTSSSGITLTKDFDGVTGVHHLRIELSDNSDPSFYEATHEYDIVAVGLTVDGVTVNEPIAHFSIARV